MAHPKITIITPSFNQGQFIEQTLDSVLSQQYPDLEYFVFDGGSTDNSLEIIRKYEKHLAFWTSEKDRGQSHAINKGLSRATGSIVNWLNSDDYYEKDTLLKVASHFEEPEILAVCGRSRIFSGADGSAKSNASLSSGTDVYQANLPKTLGWARIDQPETFFRLSAVQAMGLLNEKLHYVMDKEWWMRYLCHFGLSGIRQTEEVFVNFRLHPQSKSVSQKNGFGEETNSIFFSLASMFGLEKEKLALQQTGTAALVLEESSYAGFEESLIAQALHYYLLYQADFFYAHNDRARARLCLNASETMFLAQEDLQYRNALAMRLQVPVWLTEIMRKSLSLLKH